MRACVHACVCACVRELLSEGMRVCVCVLALVCVCVCVCVCVRVLELVCLLDRGPHVDRG